MLVHQKNPHQFLAFEFRTLDVVFREGYHLANASLYLNLDRGLKYREIFERLG